MRSPQWHLHPSSAQASSLVLMHAAYQAAAPVLLHACHEVILGLEHQRMAGGSTLIMHIMHNGPRNKLTYPPARTASCTGLVPNLTQGRQ